MVGSDLIATDSCARYAAKAYPASGKGMEIRFGRETKFRSACLDKGAAKHRQGPSTAEVIPNKGARQGLAKVAWPSAAPVKGSCYLSGPEDSP
jgi:hypothetical protein